MIEVYPLKVTNGPIINYTYLVYNNYNNDCLIVDPGWEYETIEDYLYQLKARVRGVLLTHHHYDHTLLASTFAKAFNVPVYISQAEKEFYNFNCVHLQPIIEEESISIASFIITPYLTPGHTKGGICFQIGNYLFTGDTLFIEGCGVCSGDGADPVEMFYSFEKLKEKIRPSVKVYPGHSFGTLPGVTFGYVLKNNLYMHLDDINIFVSFRMRKKQKGLFNFK